MRRFPGSDRDEEVAAAVAPVVDPALFHTLGELGTVRRAARRRTGVEVVVAVPVDPYPAADVLREAVATALAPLVGPGGGLSVELETMGDTDRSALGERLRELASPEEVGTGRPPAGGEARPSAIGAPRSRTRVLAIASGKGGVGKSTVTVNLAVALARAGRSVGLLDADITGFSVPSMIGVDHPPMLVGRTIVPPVVHGVRTMSTGFFVDEDKAVAWRGPMLHKALEQFLHDVHWGEPDFLVVDMPPGTGDVALSVAQQLPRAELYVVTTPQPAAQRVAQRAGALARQLRLPLRGVVENMSYFAAPDGTRYELFGSGGGEALAASLSVPLLAKVPLVPAVREGADDGRPAAIADPGGAVARVFEELAARVVELGPARVYRSELSVS
ncbi:MAG: Mrp/NBP35 family ATP-binding protein [Actinomycetota bacterium]|nr:Mrp/NBP35 family ATP-binding protein [Actinomycetota bacterium]